MFTFIVTRLKSELIGMLHKNKHTHAKADKQLNNQKLHRNSLQLFTHTHTHLMHSKWLRLMNQNESSRLPTQVIKAISNYKSITIVTLHTLTPKTKDRPEYHPFPISNANHSNPLIPSHPVYLLTSGFLVNFLHFACWITRSRESKRNIQSIIFLILC